MDFVREVSKPETISPIENRPKEVRKVKCIVWDLDNTLWDGVLVEDGPEKLRLKPRIEQILKALDERGILHSIVSKNNHDEARGVLENLGVEKYFVCPQISWQPKSEGIASIARQLNIGTDTLLFVDDSEFELQQVKAVHPEVRVLNANCYLGIADMDICRVPVSAESRDRRKCIKWSRRPKYRGELRGRLLRFLAPLQYPAQY